MEAVIFNIENHTISYQVNWIGIETIKVNDVQVSKKLSLPKRKHNFLLDVFGKEEAFCIKSKQLFSSGYITVQLFHNDILIEEKTLDFNFSVGKEKINNPENSSFMTGLMLITFSLVFGWSKIFLFIGLMCLFGSISERKSNSVDSQDTNDTEIKD
ncbi:hypothetical protein [Psychroserpens sp.]